MIKIMQLNQKNVISAGIAEIQKPWMTSAEHLLVAWIRFAVFSSGNPPHALTGAGSAGKTLLEHLYNQETFSTLNVVYWRNKAFTFNGLSQISITHCCLC
ncbi:MAG: hypothetical protein CTY19_07590 [Methylomonas sp.]|nr:MAG: hypothetical protein CTY19_07590 [Methylomonas sp.]